MEKIKPKYRFKKISFWYRLLHREKRYKTQIEMVLKIKPECVAKALIKRGL